MSLEITVSNNNRKVTVKAEVKDSLHASRLADRINNLPYLKVYDRLFSEPTATISCFTILGEYTIEKLHNDLDTMSDLIILPNEADIPTT